MVNVELAGQPGGSVAVLDAQLAPGAIAIGVHRCLGHAKFAGDLLGRQMLVHEPQAFALARREQPDRLLGNDVPPAHDAASKRRLRRLVYFDAKTAAGSATL
jgi:hypothetical protein